MLTKRAASCVLCDSHVLIKIHTQYLLGNFVTFFSHSHSTASPVCQFTWTYYHRESSWLTHSHKNSYAGSLTAWLLQNISYWLDKKKRERESFEHLPNAENKKIKNKNYSRPATQTAWDLIPSSSLYAKIVRIIDRLVKRSLCIKCLLFISSLVAVPRNWPSVIKISCCFSA